MAVASSPSTKGANSFFVERLPHPPLLIRSSIGAGSNSGSGAARRRLPHSPLIIIVPALPAARRGSHGRARQPRYRIRRPWSTSAPNSTGRYYFTLGPPPKKKNSMDRSCALIRDAFMAFRKEKEGEDKATSSFAQINPETECGICAHPVTKGSLSS